MKKPTFHNERGQALVLIVLAAIGLFGFAALAIDGSMVFSDRRHAQNAADTSVLDAALSKVRGGNWKAEGLDRAESNGYDNNGTTNDVLVLSCTDADATCTGLPTGADPAQYIQVKIRSDVNLFFARVIGRSTATNHVNAVARASIPVSEPWFDGHAMVSTMEGCRSAGDPYDPFTVGGHGTTIVNNSGIFVNSKCNPAFTDNGNSNLVTTTQGVCVVGGVPGGVTGVNPPPTGNCASQMDPDRWQLPNPDCGEPGSIQDLGGGVYEATPGNFNTSGNQTFPDVSPAGTLYLKRGIYCLHNGLSLNGNWIITTDLDNDDVHDPDTEGALLYVPDGDVTFNGGSTMEIHAVSSTFDNFPEKLVNYLFYIPPSNESNFTITGNNGSTFVGTILAPTSHITLNGSGNAFSLDAQVIGYDQTITGSGTINITYNAANGAIPLTNPGVELTQ